VYYQYKYICPPGGTYFFLEEWLFRILGGLDTSTCWRVSCEVAQGFCTLGMKQTMVLLLIIMMRNLNLHGWPQKNCVRPHTPEIQPGILLCVCVCVCVCVFYSYSYVFILFTCTEYVQTSLDPPYSIVLILLFTVVLLLLLLLHFLRLG